MEALQSPRQRVGLITLLLVAAAGNAIAGEHQICNHGNADLLYAVAREWEDGLSLRCELQRKNCYVELQGWFTLGRGQCQDVMVGVSWTTYLSIYEIGKDGKTRPIHYRAGEKSGENASSGLIEGAYLCLPNEAFHVRFDGTLKPALDKPKKCVDSASLYMINMWMRSDSRTDYTLDLK